MWLGSVIKKHLNCRGGGGGAGRGGNSTNEKTQGRAVQSGPANPACPRACPSSSPRQLSCSGFPPPLSLLALLVLWPQVRGTSLWSPRYAIAPLQDLWSCGPVIQSPWTCLPHLLSGKIDSSVACWLGFGLEKWKVGQGAEELYFRYYEFV